MAFGGKGSRGWLAAFCGGLILALGVTFTLFLNPASDAASAAAAASGEHLGVASCAGSTCHGRMEADGRVVRQDELRRWQEPSTQGGAHSRAFAILTGARSKQIAATLGIGDPTQAKECLGCHADPAAARGARFHASDGVGCEACHGGASGWISSHYAAGATHAGNVANGLKPLENPTVRASVCLDCHFGSDREGQFVTHRIMAAGHPRISFELDLFSTLQQHHDEDADYLQRKGAKTNSVKMWAVGQAMAVNRALSLYSTANRGTEGVFPEFYFFDCHSCHRRIYDQTDRVKTWESNPGRPIPSGMPPFNDENMIMLSAAARVGAPGMAARFEADSRAFHGALARDRGSAVAAAGKLKASAAALASALSSANLGSDAAFTIIDTVGSEAVAARYTDYEGSVQAVMAVDTLLNALVKQGRVTVGAAAGIRANINRAYDAVKEPNAYKPGDFRSALGAAVRSIRTLR